MMMMKKMKEKEEEEMRRRPQLKNSGKKNVSNVSNFSFSFFFFEEGKNVF